FYLAFSFFRMVAILEGVVRRAEDGNASNPEAADAFRKAIPLLTAAGRAALSERAPEIA
ncbi:MAG: phosphotransferase family protein, partial [Pseudomonadota bacterium]